MKSKSINDGSVIPIALAKRNKETPLNKIDPSTETIMVLREPRIADLSLENIKRIDSSFFMRFPITGKRHNFRRVLEK